MSNDAILDRFAARVRLICRQDRRHRVLWVIGEAQTGKSQLCHKAAQMCGWKHVNYTLDTGYLDTLSGREQTYRPKDAIADIRDWCKGTDTEVLLLDEIEPLLAIWNQAHRQQFYASISKAERLACGLVLVNRIVTPSVLEPLLPDSNPNRIFILSRGIRS